MPPEKTMAVLFDMDGVIVLSNTAHQIAWEAYGRLKLGVPITEEMFYRSIAGRKNEDALEELFPGRFSPDELARIGAEKEALYRSEFGPRLEPVPGVLPLIRELSDAPESAGVVIALASSAPPENVEFILSRFGVESAFSIRVDGNQVARAKPDPAIYLLAARRCGVAPESCVVLEDAVAGVQAAKSAGMRCLAVTTSVDRAALQQAGADEVRPDLQDVHLATLLELMHRT